MKATRIEQIPDSHKIKVYDALCKHFADTLDHYYTDNHVPTDPRYDSGVVSPDDPPTHTVGIEVSDGELAVLINVKGWADLRMFALELPTLGYEECIGDGWIDVEDSHAQTSHN